MAGLVVEVVKLIADGIQHGTQQQQAENQRLQEQLAEQQRQQRKMQEDIAEERRKNLERMDRLMQKEKDQHWIEINEVKKAMAELNERMKMDDFKNMTLTQQKQLRRKVFKEKCDFIGRMKVEQEPFSVLIIGAVNSGKSTLINSVFKSQLAQTSFKKCTAKVSFIKSVKVETKRYEGLELKVYDCPGFDVEEQYDSEELIEMMKKHANFCLVVCDASRVEDEITAQCVSYACSMTKAVGLIINKIDMVPEIQAGDLTVPAFLSDRLDFIQNRKDLYNMSDDQFHICKDATFAMSSQPGYEASVEELVRALRTRLPETLGCMNERKNPETLAGSSRE